MFEFDDDDQDKVPSKVAGGKADRPQPKEPSSLDVEISGVSPAPVDSLMEGFILDEEPAPPASLPKDPAILSASEPAAGAVR